MNQAVTLDRALSRVFAQNDHLVLDRSGFDEKVSGLLGKKSVLAGVREYLNSRSTSPRILALLAYSSDGNQLVKAWVEGGEIPSSALYRALMFDGSSWVKINAPFPLHETIATGGYEWDFKSEEWFHQYVHLTAFPGLLDAMVDRQRRLGRIDRVFRHMPLSTIAGVLELRSDVFKPEIAAITGDRGWRMLDEHSYSDLTRELIVSHLDRVESLSKMLGSKLEPKD